MIVSAVLTATPLDFDQAAYLAALDRAHARSYHSYFNQYVLTDDEAGFITVDEGDYGALTLARRPCFSGCACGQCYHPRCEEREEAL